MNVTMEDVLVASAVRSGKPTYVKVDDQLQAYLFMIMKKMVENPNKSGVYATLHTLLEIGIETGIHAGMKEAKRLLLEAASEAGVEISEELRNA
jgi:hypothetical protein